MQSAGEQGALLVALGTVTELGETRPPLLHMLVPMAPTSTGCRVYLWQGRLHACAHYL